MRRGQLADVKPFYVAAFVKELQREFSAPTVKQYLAALRMLVGRLVTGNVLDVEPRPMAEKFHLQRSCRFVLDYGCGANLSLRRPCSGSGRTAGRGIHSTIQ